MPGQYKHLARIMAEDPENQVVFLTLPKPNVNIPNVTKIEYTCKREVDKGTHRYLIPMSRAIFRGQEVWRVCKKLRDEKGFTPDVIVGHFGWGEGLFLKDVYHDTPMLGFMEFFYDNYSSDSSYLREESQGSPDDAGRIRIKNSHHLFNLNYCDWSITPTYYQRDQHPKHFWPMMSVLHDGIDTNAVKPNPEATFTIKKGEQVVTLSRKDEVVTYISRNFEPYRGFPEFMRAAELLLKERPNAHVIIVGQDDVSYGKKHDSGKTWRQVMMEEVDLPEDRFHCLGYLPYEKMLNVMHISRAHTYLTVPFVLSWSMMESMAAGCLMITSDTSPVQEVAEDGKNVLMVDFFDHVALKDKIIYAIDHQEELAHLRTAARQTILDYYALDKVLPMHIDLIKEVANRQFPPPTHAKMQAFLSNHKGE